MHASVARRRLVALQSSVPRHGPGFVMRPAGKFLAQADLCGRNHGGQSICQMRTLYRYFGDVAGRLIQVEPLGLGHFSLVVGEAVFRELLDRPLHVPELPRRQDEFAASRFAQQVGGVQ